MTEKTLAAVATDVMTTELREFDIPEIGADDGLLELEAAGMQQSNPIEPRVKYSWDARFELEDRYRIERKPDRSFMLYRRDRDLR